MINHQLDLCSSMLRSVSTALRHFSFILGEWVEVGRVCATVMALTDQLSLHN